MDGVFSDLCLMHNRHEDVEKIVAEIFRTLRPGGTAALQLPVYQESHEPLGPQKVGMWTPPEATKLFEGAGFEIDTLWSNQGSYVRSRIPGPNHAKCHVLRKADAFTD